MSEPLNKAWFVYIIQCKDNSFYTGVTNNLEKRLRQHNGELSGGAIYTRNKRPVVLKYFEKFETHLEAARREIEIKGWSRKKKEKLFLK